MNLIIVAISQVCRTFGFIFVYTKKNSVNQIRNKNFTYVWNFTKISRRLARLNTYRILKDKSQLDVLVNNETRKFKRKLSIRKMAENLFLEDYITLGVYFCIVLAVGLWVLLHNKFYLLFNLKESWTFFSIIMFPNIYFFFISLTYIIIIKSFKLKFLLFSLDCYLDWFVWFSM